MKNHDIFLSKWKSNHEKGFFLYLVKYILPISMLLGFSCIFFSYINGTIYTNDFYNLIKYNIFFIIFFTLLILLSWFKSEKRYKKILDDNDNNI